MNSPQSRPDSQSLGRSHLSHSPANSTEVMSKRFKDFSAMTGQPPVPVTWRRNLRHDLQPEPQRFAAWELYLYQHAAFGNYLSRYDILATPAEWPDEFDASWSGGRGLASDVPMRMAEEQAAERRRVREIGAPRPALQRWTERRNPHGMDVSPRAPALSLDTLKSPAAPASAELIEQLRRHAADTASAIQET